MMISIVVPVIRPEKAKRCFEAIKKYSNGIDYELVTGKDAEGIGCPKMVKQLVEKTTHDWVMFLGDDTIPREGFMHHAVEKIDELPDRWGMVGLNDGVWDGNRLATHWLCHKNMLDVTGGEFFHTGYIHNECDRELLDIAKEHGRYVWAEGAKIEHDNAQVKAPDEKDAHLKYVYSDEVWKHDRKMYLERKEERIGYQLGVGIPLINDFVDTLFLYSMMLQDFPDYHLYYPKSNYHPGDIARCRNDIARRALDDGCTHLIFMDTDQVYHDQTLVKQLLARKEDIVGGKVHRRWPPYEPILNRDGKHVDDKEIYAGGLVPVDTTGHGCIMVRTKVYLEMEYPWYRIVRDDYENVVYGEDVYFCRQAKEAGFDIYVDCDVNIGHLTMVEVNTDFYGMIKTLAKYNTHMKEQANGS